MSSPVSSSSLLSSLQGTLNSLGLEGMWSVMMFGEGDGGGCHILPLNPPEIETALPEIPTHSHSHREAFQELWAGPSIQASLSHEPRLRRSQRAEVGHGRNQPALHPNCFLVFLGSQQTPSLWLGEAVQHSSNQCQVIHVSSFQI